MIEVKSGCERMVLKPRETNAITARDETASASQALKQRSTMVKHIFRPLQSGHVIPCISLQWLQGT